MIIKPLALNPPINATLVSDGAGLEKIRSFFARSIEQKATILGWDIETTPTKDFFWRKCRTMQVGNTNEQYVIDLLAFCDGNSDILTDNQGHYGKNLTKHIQPVLDTLSLVVCSKDFLKVGVNLGFEYEVNRWNFGLRTFNFFSCDMVERVIYAGFHSLKDYGFYSMEEMMLRYFGSQIDKSLQESFNLTDPLTQAQVDYAALDTRLPLAIRSLQSVILSGTTPDALKKAGKIGLANQLEHLPKIIFGDDLREVAKIENDAIGAFIDMHIHGDRLDKSRWNKRIEKRKEEMIAALAELDKYLLPVVGSKHDIITEAQLDQAEAAWKASKCVPDEQFRLKAAIRLERTNPVIKAQLEDQLAQFIAARKAETENLKTRFMQMRKLRNMQLKIVEKAAGEALINYASGAQLLNVLRGLHKDLKNLEDTEDETLEMHEHIPVMAALRNYRGISKEISTYGLSWTQEWITKPCKEEGWLHPGDGRLHCKFNQTEAETGRSSSSQPNAQNLPQDEEVRSCFIADPPNENIRISCCCDSDTTNPTGEHFICDACGKVCQTKPEEYVIVTADMSGAELRIIAELADDPIWIGAFSRGEDVHSVGTEIMYAELWPTLTVRSIENPESWPVNSKERITIIIDGKEKQVPPCAYFAKKPNGELAREKCKCPEHNHLRNDNKSTNFLLAYGGGPTTLAKRIKKALQKAKDIMELHSQKFPRIWAYLEQSGKRAKMLKRAFDMFGRRRLFPEPTWELAIFKAKEDREKKLRYPDEIIEKNIADWIAKTGQKPKGKIAEIDSEYYLLSHRAPTDKEIANAFKAMHGSIERQGKNHCIQGTNATIAKLAMGCGYDSKEGKPFLWHTLPLYKAILIKFVHDELVVQVPKRYGEKVAALIGDAFRRAAAEKMKKVVMEFDKNIASHWKK